MILALSANSFAITSINKKKGLSSSVLDRAPVPRVSSSCSSSVGGMTAEAEAPATKKKMGLVELYSQALATNPWTTKIVSSTVISATGDIINQCFLTKNAVFDWRRLVVFAAAGGLYFGPIINVWFDYLSKIKYPAAFGKAKVALAMLAIDQTAGAVVINAGFFMLLPIVSF
jgi:hypothetical protein